MTRDPSPLEVMAMTRPREKRARDHLADDMTKYECTVVQIMAAFTANPVSDSLGWGDIAAQAIEGADALWDALEES